MASKIGRIGSVVKGMNGKGDTKTSSVFANELLDSLFRDPTTKQGLKFFTKGERSKLKLRANDENKIEIFCAKRERWLRAKPEEVVRQMFLIWLQDSLGYWLQRIQVEWPIQMGEDSEKERADIVVFTDDACTDPFIVYELKRPDNLFAH